MKILPECSVSSIDKQYEYWLKNHKTHVQGMGFSFGNGYDNLKI